MTLSEYLLLMSFTPAVSLLQAAAVPQPCSTEGKTSVAQVTWPSGDLSLHLSLAAGAGLSSPPFPSPTVSYLVAKLGFSRVGLSV